MIRPLIMALLLPSLLSTGAHAAETAVTAEKYTSSAMTAARDSDKNNTALNAKRWALTVEEWDRYEEIMQGEGRYNWRDVDPITVLGIYAETDAARERYAERLAIQEHTLQKRFLALNGAYLKAFQRLYGNEPILSMDTFNEFYDQTASAPVPRTNVGVRAALNKVTNNPGAIGNNSYVLFISPGCKGCDDYYRKIRRIQTVGISLDIYFVGVDDKQIIDWARTMSLDPALVKSKVVTLNRDDGTYARYNRPPLPSAFFYDRAAGTVSPLEQ